MANQPDHRSKEQLRRHYRAILANLGGEEAAVWSKSISSQLGSWLGERPAAVAVFAALPGEPDLADLHQICPRCRWIYPRVEGDDLVFHEVRDRATLLRGSFGILEPDPDRHPIIALDALDVILCPGLAFAQDGVRLGRGKGFYDRALTEARSAVPRVGVGFAVQFAESLPAEGHDQDMTHLASEDGVSDLDSASA